MELRRGRNRMTGWYSGVFLFIASIQGCVPVAGEQTVEAAPPSARAAEAQRGERPQMESPRLARRLLDTLPVRERAARTGYAREQYGQAWFDADRNGCDTRNDILRRDLSDARFEAGRRDCVVEAGRLKDLYTGAEIVFERGAGSTLDIDHVVALADAWVTGAAEWKPERRVALANDPLNLLAVSAAANRSKGDRDAGRWLPPSRDAHCVYVARQIAVKVKYALWVTADEHEAMARVLGGCPDALAPTGEAPVEVALPREQPVAVKPLQGGARREAPAEGKTQAKTTPKATPKAGGADPDYGTCKAAKANGAGPYHRGRDPEYDYYRDADGDGIVCE